MSKPIDDLRARGLIVTDDIAAEDLASLVRVTTELDEVQQRLRRLADAGSAGLVACIVAHDARNVLAPMVIAADELVASASPRTADLAGWILDGCRRLSAMVSDVIGKRGEGPELTNVNVLIADLASTLHQLVGPAVQVTTRFEHPIPPVRIAPTHLERALLNLIANARDAMPDGGRIRVSTSSVTVPPDDGNGVPEGNWVVVEVEDRGVGMDAATAARVFEPFFTTKPPALGTGLGMTSVRSTIRTASGEIRIRSELGKGTSVQLWLPVAR